MDMLVFGFAAALSYWYETEMFLFLGCAYLMCRFLHKWYTPLMGAWPPDRGRAGRWVLGCLPPVSLAIILFVLLTMASYDVVGIWVVFYVMMGYAWLKGGIYMLECLDLSWPFDAVHLDNKAAIVPAAGGFVGVTLIYAGANTGDGPGWWVVLFAAGLGLGAWLGLALLINLRVGISERISVDRDMGSGIRFGAYLIASGLILAYASGGDWTSTQAALLEFCIGWPVLPLMLFFILVERFYIGPSRSLGTPVREAKLFSSVLWGGVYLAYSVIVVLGFHGISEGVSGGVFL
ncbi:MAG: hypothetical protein LIP16_02455 [Clostridium sp.]|nr:hypothetical protein [Clostridium sp.]